MTGQSVNLKAMLTGASGDAALHDNAREDISEGVDRVPHSSELLSFVDAVLNHGDPAPDVHATRTALRDVLSDAAFVDACATVASFNAVVKVADGTGIPLEPQKAEKTAQLRAELDIDQLRDQGRFNQP
jgi:hypothetical protein